MKNKIIDKPTARTDRRRWNRVGCPSVLLFVLCQLSTVIGLTSCTDDVAPADEQAVGSPVEFIARIADHVQSRATADNTWNGGEEVGVQIDDKCYKYIADASGKLTPASGEEPPRWNNPNDEKTVMAWYPYSDKLPKTFTVQKEQNEDDNYDRSDFLLAKETRISFGNPEITFRHLPAKVVVNIKAGDGVLENSLSQRYVGMIKIKNQQADNEGSMQFVSGTIAPDGTVEPVPAKSVKDSLWMQEISPAPGYFRSFRALLVPQDLAKGVRLIQIGYVQRSWFYYTPQSDDELKLEAGKKYVYNITVMKDGLSVVRYEGVMDWDTEEKDINRKETKGGYRAQDVKPFDYYYSDGAWSDGGYRQFTDGTEAWLDIAPTEGKKVIGIVFQSDQKRMSRTEINKGWKHGYAVALTLCEGFEVPWGVNYKQVPGMAYDALTDFTACRNSIYGYEATQKVISTIGNGHVEALKDTKYQAFYRACQYGKTDNTKQYAAPTKSSGWYLPSVGQWWDIAENLYRCQFDTPDGSPGGGQKKNFVQKYLKTQLSWLPDGKDLLGFPTSYWTSSIYDKENKTAWYIRFSKKEKDEYTILLKPDWKETKMNVRAIIAF